MVSDGSLCYAEKGYGTYKFIWNNCKDYAQEILSLGDYDHSLEELAAKLEFTPSPALYYTAIGSMSTTSRFSEGVWNYAKKLWSFIQEAVR